MPASSYIPLPAEQRMYLANPLSTFFLFFQLGSLQVKAIVLEKKTSSLCLLLLFLIPLIFNVGRAHYRQ